jgi:hypothetical protein
LHPDPGMIAYNEEKTIIRPYCREKKDYFSCRMRTYGELREKNPAMNEANSGR